MTLEDLTERLISELHDAKIPYMVVGSFASSFHGEPRMTRDLDVVTDLRPRVWISWWQG